MFEILDLALLFGLIALILWILSITGVVALGGVAYIFLVIAIILFLIWVVLRFCFIASSASANSGWGDRSWDNGWGNRGRWNRNRGAGPGPLM